MSLKLRWAGKEDFDRIAEVRMLAYSGARKELPRFQEGIANDPYDPVSEHVLAERDGIAVGVATSIPMTMYVRGGPISCQGVASVGTVRTERRKTGDGVGVGSAVMQEVVRHARERGFVASALMPFRVSFYERFGYGVVERKREWTIPLELIPRGESGSIRYYRDADFDELAACRQRIAEANHCDMARSSAAWKMYIRWSETGFLLVDRAGDGPLRGWMMLLHQSGADGADTVCANWDFGWEDIGTLRRFLHFLSSLRDQYRYASLHLPADFPLNLLLKEKQMTHRPSRNHANSTERQYTRMQVRVLDHKRFLEPMKLIDASTRGKAVVAVHEGDGVSKFEIDVAEGRVTVKSSDSSPDVECAAQHWAMVACGDVEASLAAELGLLSVNRSAALPVLDVLAKGPRPYCREYF